MQDQLYIPTYVSTSLPEGQCYYKGGNIRAMCIRTWRCWNIKDGAF